MLNSAVLFLKFSLFSYSVLSENTYECGEHGRFEYCIDEIPGCVIGCHCHPGYYFDTDTKICEPNTKLIDHHRRHHTGEPTRILNAATPSIVSETASLLKSKVDDQVDEISNDANDLGDWLYNQFFKTIENQVVNSTSEKDEEQPTRRSGSTIKKPKIKKKWNRNRKSNKKTKRRKLRNKLLRITEDDSMFDMASHSSSDSSDSSSSESSVEHHVHNNDDVHGHKKIIVYNKKPKPPLPSFIFVPNLETPFYPPIGLPPPPVVPMYPIVPVPPVVPFGIEKECSTTEGKTSPPTTAPPSTTSVSVTAETTTPTIQSTTDLNPQRLLKKRKKKIPRVSSYNINNEDDAGFDKLQPINRQKLLSRIRDRMNRPSSAKYFMSPWQKHKKILMNTDNRGDDFESPLIENDIPENLLERNEELPRNVEFKYLTELIHRDMKNKTNDLPPIEYNPLESIEMYKAPNIDKHDYTGYIVPPNTPDGRRYPRPGKNKLDDSYYTKLGREIASMIRGIDVQNRNANIQIEQKRDSAKGELYFNNNSPRSYWERSVRSPLTFLNMNKNKFEYLKKSNELLFDIENKIEIIASTVPTMSLQEIENIVRVIDVAKKAVKNRESNIKSLLSNTHNFNINLWPQRIGNNVLDNSKMPSKFERQDTSKGKSIGKPSVPDGTRIQMQEVQRLVAWQKPRKAVKPDTQQTDIRFQTKPDVKSLYQNTLRDKDKPQYDNRSKIAPLPPPLQNNSRETLLGYDMNSIFLKRKKYFDEDHNFYIPKPPSNTRATHPSYFHQEINHFDYIN